MRRRMGCTRSGVGHPRPIIRRTVIDPVRHQAPACRPGCAACCTAPSISSVIPGMPFGKPAGVPCVQLDYQGRCKIFGQPQRPAVCVSLQPSAEMCGSGRHHAMAWLGRLELLTAP